LLQHVLQLLMQPNWLLKGRDLTSIEINDDGVLVDAETIADALGLTASQVRGLMQSGAITTRCEKGVDEDEGRWRLTFFYNNRAVRLTVGEDNRIVSRARFDAPRRRPHPFTDR